MARERFGSAGGERQDVEDVGGNSLWVARKGRMKEEEKPRAPRAHESPRSERPRSMATIPFFSEGGGWYVGPAGRPRTNVHHGVGVVCIRGSSYTKRISNNKGGERGDNGG
eukprot:754762-Hanusia_phi.AAC.3